MKYAFVGLATLLGGFFGLAQSVRAQSTYAEDALLYSRQGPAGTARVLGLAGANVSLGGDFSNLTSNPAGLGLFTKSEISLTPGVGLGSASSGAVANAANTGALASLNQTANSFHIASAGVVFASRRPDSDNSSDWRGGSFALGFTRLADFNQSFSYQNQTDDGHSFFQFLREPGGYTDPANPGYRSALADIRSQDNSGNYETLDGLAYGNFLTTVGTTKFSGLDSLITPARVGPITQREQVLNKGSMSQFDLGYGGNYRDRLYLGLGVGIVSLNRTRTSTFSESSNGGEDFNYQDYLKTTGTGINARLGFIYRAADAVRFGASVQTPTYIRLSDSYSTTLTSQYTPANLSNVLSTTPGTYEYSVTMPFRANGGLTVLLNKYGFLTGDVEYLNYSSTSFSPLSGTSTNIDDNNAVITNNYCNVINLRAGAEGRFDIFRARVGFAHYASPYAGTAPYNRDQNYFTGGVGIRGKSYFVDVAGVYLTYKNRSTPYTLASGPDSATNGTSPVITTDYSRFTVSLTGGFIF